MCDAAGQLSHGFKRAGAAVTFLLALQVGYVAHAAKYAVSLAVGTAQDARLNRHVDLALIRAHHLVFSLPLRRI